MTIFEARQEGDIPPDLAEARRDIQRVEQACHGMGEVLGMEWISHGFVSFGGSTLAFLFSSGPDAEESPSVLALSAENDLTASSALDLLRKEIERRREEAPVISAA